MNINENTVDDDDDGDDAKTLNLKPLTPKLPAVDLSPKSVNPSQTSTCNQLVS